MRGITFNGAYMAVIARVLGEQLRCRGGVSVISLARQRSEDFPRVFHAENFELDARS
jgi:hypothetical protein